MHVFQNENYLQMHRSRVNALLCGSELSKVSEKCVIFAIQHCLTTIGLVANVVLLSA